MIYCMNDIKWTKIYIYIYTCIETQYLHQQLILSCHYKVLQLKMLILYCNLYLDKIFVYLANILHLSKSTTNIIVYYKILRLKMLILYCSLNLCVNKK